MIHGNVYSALRVLALVGTYLGIITTVDAEDRRPNILLMFTDDQPQNCFDLESDPQERVNLAKRADLQSVLTELQRLCDRKCVD